jgi:hypothetical protein
LRAMVVSDGPAGVRGITMDERNPAASLPCPSALGATWDPDLVQALAAALGAEARSKGVDVLLAPTINVMRTPLGGRGFESFGEDPVLIARIAVAFVRGLHQAGAAAAVKHYVSNDSETGRWTYDARIAEHVLRELYLVPFEACVREADVDLVMTGYNKVNCSPASSRRSGASPAWPCPTGTPPAARWRPPSPASTWPCRARTGRGAASWPRRSGPGRSARTRSTPRCCVSCGWPAGSGRSATPRPK